MAVTAKAAPIQAVPASPSPVLMTRPETTGAAAMHGYEAVADAGDVLEEGAKVSEDSEVGGYGQCGGGVRDP
jgi:hypothetical protein